MVISTWFHTKNGSTKYLDANYTINLIRQTFNSPSGRDKIWILVEGEDDCKIYPKFFQEKKCKIEQVYGGIGQLEIAIDKLQKYNDLVIGIRDADFCHITNNYFSFSNLFYTDYHDIEMMMVHNDSVFKNILFEYGLSEISDSLRNNLLEETSFIGYLRYYNELNDCQINFKGLSFGKFHSQRDDDCLILLKNELINELNIRSSNKRINIDETAINIFSKTVPLINCYQLVSGHDFIKLLAFRINFSLKSNKVNDKEISKLLRNSYRIDEFKNTDLFKHIYGWQFSLGVDILNDNKSSLSSL